MRKTVSVAGVVATTAGMMAVGGGAALADESGGDGIRVLDDTNVEIAPIQICNTEINVVGLVAPIGSAAETECSGAPVSDHPEQDASDPAEEEAQDPAEDREGDEEEQEDPAESELPDPQLPDAPEINEPEVPEMAEEENPAEENPAEEGDDVSGEEQAAADGSESSDEALSEAPAPKVIQGHLPVTG